MGNNYIHIGTLNDHSQDHSKHVTINAPGADVSAIVRSFFAEDVTPEDLSSNSPEFNSGSSSPAPDNRQENIIPIPKEGKYSKVREYIKERSRFDEEFKNFVKEKSLRDLCARLTKEFGWYVDEHSLGSNLNRHRKD